MSLKPEIETKSNPLDVAVLVLALASLLGGLVGYYYFSELPQWQRYGMAIGGFGLGVVLAVMTHPGRSAWDFMIGSRNEVRKMVWPTRNETMQTTLMVLVITVILAIIMWGMDAVLGIGAEYLTGRRG